MKSYILTVIIMIFCSPSVFGQGKSYGEIIPDDFEQSTVFTKKPNEGLVKIPGAIDLADKMPPAGDQNPLGTCWAFATTYAIMSYMDNVAKRDRYFYIDREVEDKRKIMSPELPIQLYFQGGNCNVGATSKIVMQTILSTYGAISLEDLPYSAKCNQKLGISQINQAKNRIRRNHSVEVIRPSDIGTLKQVLAENQPVLLSMSVDDVFNSIGYNIKGKYLPMWDKIGTKSAVGGHAMVIVGYDDSVQAVKVLNSWGRQWGNNGYVWISYKVLNNFANYYCYPKQVPNLAVIPDRSVETVSSSTTSTSNEMASWFKAGYYRNFDNLRIALSNFNITSNTALIKIRDNNGLELLSFFVEMKSTKEFIVNEKKYQFVFNDIANAGKLPTKAVWFTIRKI